ncbi:TRAM domain-containing protein [Rhodococcus ruber]|uniref:TRAM domain-containing protein n=1 Tax=Rhodococcus ruber TaxID=1830 RepID=A0ABT4MBQ8_9NOCA|nr:TRAM domain-containing protein [Rhodococcus ruber]MCZ4518391.1 TRAM domain-containing protein [Rhodococcus ruber]
MTESWFGLLLEVELGAPGHGGFCVARHEGRVVFVRHGLPGERVVARVTEDRGGSFCRADAVEILSASADRVDTRCPIAGPGGSGCCDYSHATADAGRRLKSFVVAEQLRRVAGVEREVRVEELPGTGDGTGWRTRVRLAVDSSGRPGYHRYRSSSIVNELSCPQMDSAAFEGLSGQQWRPGAELQVVLDGAGTRHVVEVAPAQISTTGRRSPGRRGASARRAASSRARPEKAVIGSGRVTEYVSDRAWTLDATGFWQAHRGAAQVYTEVVTEWADASPGDGAWDLYGGVGVFAASLAVGVGQEGHVTSVEFSRRAAEDGRSALADLTQVSFVPGRVERSMDALAEPVAVAVLDPPRAGAGRDVIDALAARGPRSVVHVGCDPASFARDVSLYRAAGYELTDIRAFDAFPLTSHVECIGRFVRK